MGVINLVLVFQQSFETGSLNTCMEKVDSFVLLDAETAGDITQRALRGIL